MKKCLTCEEVTKYDQCPCCNPDGFIDKLETETNEKRYWKFFNGLVYLAPAQFNTRTTMLKAMIKSVGEESIVIPNLCRALIETEKNKHLYEGNN